MKTYIVYFANNVSYLSKKESDFNYSVEANNEEEAKQKAITLFSESNPELDLANYTYGFTKN